MKRCLGVGAAIIVSLLMGWASAYTASRLGLRTVQRALPGCRETGHCDAPLWIDGLLLAWLVGPPCVFGAVAYVGLGRSWSGARWLGAFGLLSSLTAAFYCAWYRYGA